MQWVDDVPRINCSATLDLGAILMHYSVFLTHDIFGVDRVEFELSLLYIIKVRYSTLVILHYKISCLVCMSHAHG